MSVISHSVLTHVLLDLTAGYLWLPESSRFSQKKKKKKKKIPHPRGDYHAHRWELSIALRVFSRLSLISQGVSRFPNGIFNIIIIQSVFCSFPIHHVYRHLILDVGNSSRSFAIRVRSVFTFYRTTSFPLFTLTNYTSRTW